MILLPLTGDCISGDGELMTGCWPELLTDCLIGQDVAENNQRRQRRAECDMGMSIISQSH